MMKNKKSILFSFLLTMTLTACYDSLLDYDGNASIINREDGTSSSTGILANAELASEFLRTAQMRVIDSREHKYQYQRSFISDDYAGYMSVPHSFDGRLKSSLSFYADFASGPTANMQWVAQQVVPVMRSSDTLKIAPLGAFASILFSDEAIQYTNVHGPMPLKDYKELKEYHPLTYEKQSEVYSQIFRDLIKADSILEVYQEAPTNNLDALIEKTDMVTEQTSASAIVRMWRKYANSLILRMAMTTVNVEGYICMVNGVPKTARQLGEEAVQRGVLEAGDKTIGLICGSGTDVGYHPLYKIANSWVDSRLNASYHNILVRTQHPILEFWFAKNGGDIKNQEQKTLKKETEYVSIRSGITLDVAGVTSQNYQYYSKFNLNFAGEKLALFKTEEALFLRAEGALRGWSMGGSAQSFYEAGIKEFFDKHSMSGRYDEYMAWRGMGDQTVSSTLKNEAIYRDWYDADNNLPLWSGYYQLNNAWYFPANADNNPYYHNPDEDKEQALQKIITQKWITLFPMSLVAWTDYRRTGYPLLIPACPYAYGYSDGSLEEPRFNWITGEILTEGVTVRRIPYNSSDSEIVEEVELTAKEALNSETTGISMDDWQGTRLWWDVANRKKLQ